MPLRRNCKATAKKCKNPTRHQPQNSAMAKCTMMRHQKNVVAQIAVLPHTKNRFGMMLQHAAQCCGTSRQCRGISYTVVQKNSITARSTMPWHTQKNSARGTLPMLWHKKASQHDHGTKTSMWHNATANCGRPWQKAQCHGTSHIATAQSILPQHKAYCRSTISCRGTQKSPRHKNAAAQSAMLWHIKQCYGSKIMPQNAAEECTMLLQKTAKSKMPPNTTTTMPPRPPKPNRLIVFPP